MISTAQTPFDPRAIWAPRSIGATQRWLAFGLAAASAAGLLWWFRAFALDDAFITYRVAQQLAAGHGLVYNAGEPVLTTTAPGYAVLLAAGAKLGLPVDRLGLVTSVLSLVAAAWTLAELGAGVAGAALLATSPLLLGTLGMETCTQVALVFAGLLGAARGRPFAAFVCAGLACAVRPDAALPALLVALTFLLANGRDVRARPAPAILAALAGGLIVAALYAWLWRQFGTPLPNTLAAKVTQRALGFYGYLEGMRVWAAETLGPSWWYAPGALLAVVGAAASFSKPFRWNLALILWAAAHTVAYLWLDVAGYAWYYAPLAVAFASTAAVGVRVVGRHWSIGALALALVLAPQLATDAGQVSRLPDPHLRLYRQAGEWLAGHSPPASTVGVMEVGVVGYYAQRTMIDFAGLTRPDTVAALSRGDIFWTIAHDQPDFLVLTNKNPLYSYDLQDDPWFLAAYQPVTGFHDDRWWGSPVTIFRRRVALPDAPVSAPVGATYGPHLRLDAYDLDRTVVRPGDFIHLTAHWTRTGGVGGTWKLFVHLIDDTYKVYGGSDVAVYPQRWPLGQQLTTEHFLHVPADLRPGLYHVEIGWYDPATLKRLPVTDARGRAAGETVVLHAVVAR